MNNGSIFVKLILGQLINGRKKRIICCRSIHQTAAGAIQMVQHTGKASATLILNFMSCSVHTLVLYCVVSRLKILWVVLSLTITSVGQMASQRVRGATNCSFSSDYTPLGWGQVQYEGNINSIFHRPSPVNSCPKKSFPIDIFRVCFSSKTLLFHKNLSCWSQAPEIIFGDKFFLKVQDAHECFSAFFWRSICWSTLLMSGAFWSVSFLSWRIAMSIRYAIKTIVEYFGVSDVLKLGPEFQPLQAFAVGCTWEQEQFKLEDGFIQLKSTLSQLVCVTEN